ncbi:hypothetical protein [Virgibacillus ainsalahensis]
MSLALTIPRNTPLLLLDEPTSFMDIPSKKHLMDILVDWMDQEERSIVITSHQVEDIRKLADYLFVLQSGKVIGNFEKEALTESFRRYWMSGTLPAIHIPGEISRKDLQLVSNDPPATEKYFQDHSLQLIDQTALELEEIITLLLKKG